jgi:hypothetical protein
MSAPERASAPATWPERGARPTAEDHLTTADDLLNHVHRDNSANLRPDVASTMIARSAP